MNSQAEVIKPLTIRDKVSAIPIRNIYNYPASTSNLSAFKNKLVILDFMATNCVSCIRVLPRLDSIQKRYGDKVQVFLVTHEKRENVKKFLLNHPTLKLAIIGEDTLLAKYFPHTYISHEVWIKDGVVKAITYPEYVNNKNIEFLLAGNKVNWPVKKDLIDFDYSKPLPAATFYSAVTLSLPDVPWKFIQTTDTLKEVSRTLAVNMSIPDLYMRAYGRSYFSRGHIMLNVQDTSKFVYDSTDYYEAWKSANTFCYESVLPLKLSAVERRNKMLVDLNLFFGLDGRIEFIPVTGYALVRTDSATALLTKETSRALAKVEGSKSLSLKELTWYLNESWYGMPAVDETGITGKLYVNIPGDVLKDPTRLQQVLKVYGLKIIECTINAEMLVIEENKLKIKNEIHLQ
jgi:thiol-disulfide isomerase/thioredoxin